MHDRIEEVAIINDESLEIAIARLRFWYSLERKHRGNPIVMEVWVAKPDLELRRNPAFLLSDGG